MKIYCIAKSDVWKYTPYTALNMLQMFSTKEGAIDDYIKRNYCGEGNISKLKQSLMTKGKYKELYLVEKEVY